MLSRLSLTAYGGIGVITPTDGEAILIMVGVDTHLITVTVAGPMAGAVSTAVSYTHLRIENEIDKEEEQ